MTLTLKHSNAPLVTQIEKLYADFQKLRKDKQFKKLCTGGVWFFQIKLIKETQQWHPHIHCILAGKWISKEWLSQKWLRVTKSSFIVDIKMVRDPDSTANEVARYAATPAQIRDLPEELRMEVFDAMHRRRLCGTWGIAKPIQLSPPRSVDKDKYEDIGSFSTVVGLADTDARARRIYLAWVSNTPLEADVNIRDIDDFVESRVRILQSDIDAGKYDPVLEYK